MLELSGFLREIQCGYEVFSDNTNVNNRMQSVESRYLLIEWLASELMTQKMLLVTKPKDKGSVITIVRFVKCCEIWNKMMKFYFRMNHQQQLL